VDLEVKIESTSETGQDQAITMQLLQTWSACTKMLYLLALPPGYTHDTSLHAARVRPGTSHLR
jgi:hypothetical protein